MCNIFNYYLALYNQQLWQRNNAFNIINYKLYYSLIVQPLLLIQIIQQNTLPKYNHTHLYQFCSPINYYYSSTNHNHLLGPVQY